MMRVYLFYTIILAAIVMTIRAAPTHPESDAKDVSLVKRMENGDDSDFIHDRSCLCLLCYARRVQAVPVRLRRGNELITNPILQAICYPSIKLADWALEDCERDLNRMQVEELIANHKTWLRRQNVDPNQVQVIPKRDGSEASTSSSSRGVQGAMDAPQPESPMGQEQGNTTRRRQLRRAP